MSKILDKINDMLVQKFPDATRVEIDKDEDSMSTKVTYSTGIKAEGTKSLNGETININIIKEEE